eukprot:jgi/Picsp_1/4105/NSC_01615-R1_protein
MNNCTDSVESEDLEILLRRLNIAVELEADNESGREGVSDRRVGASTTEQRLSVAQESRTWNCVLNANPGGNRKSFQMINSFRDQIDVVDLAGESSRCSSEDELVVVRSVPNKKTIPRMVIASSDEEEYYNEKKENDDAYFVDMTQEEEETDGPCFNPRLVAELQSGRDTIDTIQMREFGLFKGNGTDENKEIWSVDTLRVSLEDVGIGGGVKNPSEQHKKFKENRVQLAKSLYRKYNKAVFGNKLPFTLDISWNKRLMTTAGLTHYRRQLVGDGMMYHARIELSCKVVDTADKLERTLVHEMCHCAAWIIDHVSKPPHGAVFKKWAQQAMQVAPHLDVRTCHQYDIFYAYRWQCTSCLQEIGRHSKSIDVNKKVCGSCRGPLQYLGKFARDGSPSKRRQKSEYCKFVQAAFPSVKAQMGNPNATNSDVMKRVAAIWKEKKSWTSL